MSKFSIAYSPDTDDAFMAYAWRNEKIPSQLPCEFYIDDIQKLNVLAKKGLYDISAISFAAYPWLQLNYQLLPLGASVGRGFGPAIVTSQNSGIKTLAELAGKKIAVPGFMTTAFLSACCLLQKFEPVEKYFLDIAEAVQKNEVAAGILIHELQLDCEDRGFVKLGNLGILWREKYHLPLPLGANVIRRNLPEAVKKSLAETYLDSIRWALDVENRGETITAASEVAVSGFKDKKAVKYIEMYVNNDSLGFTADVVKSCEILYKTATDLKLSEPVDLSQAIYSFS